MWGMMMSSAQGTRLSISCVCRYCVVWAYPWVLVGIQCPLCVGDLTLSHLVCPCVCGLHVSARSVCLVEYSHSFTHSLTHYPILLTKCAEKYPFSSPLYPISSFDVQSVVDKARHRAPLLYTLTTCNSEHS